MLRGVKPISGDSAYAYSRYFGYLNISLHRVIQFKLCSGVWSYSLE